MKYDNFRSLKVRVEDHFPLITARKRSLRRLCFTCVCLSVREGVSKPTSRVKVEGSGGYPRPTPGGGAQAQAGVGGGCIPACTEADSPPAKQTASAAGGMHPTGMHSCVQVRFHTASSCGEKVYAKLVTLTEFTMHVWQGSAIWTELQHLSSGHQQSSSRSQGEGQDWTGVWMGWTVASRHALQTISSKWTQDASRTQQTSLWLLQVHQERNGETHTCKFYNVSCCSISLKLFIKTTLCNQFHMTKFLLQHRTGYIWKSPM